MLIVILFMTNDVKLHENRCLESIHFILIRSYHLLIIVRALFMIVFLVISDILETQPCAEHVHGGNCMSSECLV